MSRPRLTKHRIDELMGRKTKRRKCNKTRTETDERAQSVQVQQLDKITPSTSNADADEEGGCQATRSNRNNGKKVSFTHLDVEMERRNLQIQPNVEDIERDVPKDPDVDHDEVEDDPIQSRVEGDEGNVTKDPIPEDNVVGNTLDVEHDINDHPIDREEPEVLVTGEDHDDQPGKNGNKTKEVDMSADNLLGCLLTCGSKRLNSVMYNVVRTVLGGRECNVCGASVTGARLPGLTYLKTSVKPSAKLNLLPRHETIQVRVNLSRAGAKLGIEKYVSDAKAPLTFVKPSEWARVDFATPSVKELIWGGEPEEEELFCNIESTPIVRHRSFFAAVNTVRDFGWLETLVDIGSRLKLTLIRNSKTDKALERSFGKSVVNETVNDVESALVTCNVIAYAYVTDDQPGHNCVVSDMEPVVFQRHEGCEEKAGDVIFYLECQYGKAMLVNRHNNFDSRRPCTLELCNGKRTGCHIRTYPVEDVEGLDVSAQPVDEYVPNKGRLEDGTKYYVYRVLLYTDGFNAHRSRLGSMDGMYMMPLGIPVDRRTEAGGLHKICLAPPGVAATDIIDLVIKDLAEGMRYGIEVDDDGERALIFLDILCYTGDSPALSSATGTKGHSADSPCHACSMRKDKNEVLRIVGNDVSTSTCFAKRTHRKIRDIERQGGNVAETLDGIGVSNSNAPLMKLSDGVKKLTNIPKTSEGKQVVPNCFDAFRFSLISPDHVFLGLIANALELFMKLMKREDREKFDAIITYILRRNKMYGRTTILNSDKNIMKTTISEAFAILFAAPLAIKCCKLELDEEKDKALKLSILVITQLSEIIVKSQRHPKKGVDSERDLRGFNNSKGKTRLYRIIADVKKHCETIKTLSKADPINVRILDKPNMHRFVELFIHTLPMFGSMRFIEELILEKAHQTAKKAIDMSNNKNEQLQAMADYLFDDFICRLKSITKAVGSGDASGLGENIAKLNGRSCGLTLDAATDRNVLSVVRTLGKDICHGNNPEEWRVEEKSLFKVHHGSEKKLNQAKRFLEKALELLKERESWNDWYCDCSSSAILVKPLGEMGEVRRVTKVSRFEVLEFHCRDGAEQRPFVFRRTELDGERRFLAVIGFLKTLQDGRKVEYAVGYFMDELEREELKSDKADLEKTSSENVDQTCDVEVDEIVYGGNRRCVVLLELSRSVRKAFVGHACWLEDGITQEVEGLSIAAEVSKSIHQSSEAVARSACKNGCLSLQEPSKIVEGGKWVLKGRQEGFPPRSG